MWHTLRFEQQSLHPTPHHGMGMMNTLITELFDVILTKFDVTHD